MFSFFFESLYAVFKALSTDSKQKYFRSIFLALLDNFRTDAVLGELTGQK